MGRINGAMLVSVCSLGGKNLCVGAGKEDSFVAVVVPSDMKWRFAALAFNVEHYCSTICHPDARAPYDQSIPWRCTHS